MRLEFEIINIPTAKQLNAFEKEAYVFYLEGVLKIFIKNCLFFNQPAILLIEFAIFIRKWLDKIETGNLVDFIYETMDHEEPILLLIHVKNGFYRIDSIYSLFTQ